MFQFYQQLGRGLRQYPGKAFCVVVDFIGNFQNAYRVPEYHALDPDPASHPTGAQDWTARSLLNLPLGCRVHFDERVVDVFAEQTLNPRFANRHNIAQILFYQYDKLWRRIGRRPRRDDVDRGCLLDTSLYVLVFGSWTAFERLAVERHRLAN